MQSQDQDFFKNNINPHINNRFCPSEVLCVSDRHSVKRLSLRRYLSQTDVLFSVKGEVMG